MVGMPPPVPQKPVQPPKQDLSIILGEYKNDRIPNYPPYLEMDLSRGLQTPGYSSTIAGPPTETDAKIIAIINQINQPPSKPLK